MQYLYLNVIHVIAQPVSYFADQFSVFLLVLPSTSRHIQENVTYITKKGKEIPKIRV